MLAFQESFDQFLQKDLLTIWFNPFCLLKEIYLKDKTIHSKLLFQKNSIKTLWFNLHCILRGFRSQRQDGSTHIVFCDEHDIVFEENFKHSGFSV